METSLFSLIYSCSHFACQIHVFHHQTTLWEEALWIVNKYRVQTSRK